MKIFLPVIFLFAVTLTFAQTKTQEAIKKLDKQWLIDTYFTGNMTKYDRIVADDFKITHSNGNVLNKAEKRADILASKINDSASPFKIGESTVQIYGKTAVSSGYIIEKNSNVRFTNIYVKRNGRWQVVASQLTGYFPPETNAEAEIKQLTEDLRKAYLTGDKLAFDRIIAGDWMITLSGGKVVENAKADEMDGVIALDSSYILKNDEVKVRFYSPNTAVVTMLTTEKGKYEERVIDTVTRVINIVIRRNGRWQIVSTHLTRIAPLKK